MQRWQCPIHNGTLETFMEDHVVFLTRKVFISVILKWNTDSKYEFQTFKPCVRLLCFRLESVYLKTREEFNELCETKVGSNFSLIFYLFICYVFNEFRLF